MRHPSKVAVLAGCVCDLCHPSEAAYVAGCKCEPCLARRRRVAKLRAIYGPSLVDAGPAVERVQQLVAEGFKTAHIARICGTDGEVIRDMAHGLQTRVLRTTSDRVLSLTRAEIIAEAADLEHVPPIGARRRIHALRRIGWPVLELAGGDRRFYDTMRRTSRGYNRTIVAQHYRRIAALYDRLSMTTGPSASSAKRAEKAGLAPPLAWDDDEIDDPNATPYVSPPTEHEIRLSLYQAGMSDRAIGAELGVSGDVIRSWRNRHGLPPNYIREPELGAEGDDRLELYRQGWTDQAIGEVVGRHYKVIRRWRVKHGLPPIERAS